MKKAFLFIATILLLGLVVGCKQTTEEELKYTVTFDTAGGTLITEQEILNGGKVTKPSDPLRDGYLFSGDWMNGTFEWDFDIDIVTEDVTLIATWIEISSTPTNIMVTDEIFSSNITWQQTDAELQTFSVYVKPVDGISYTEINGTFDIDDQEVLDTVVFTPTEVPQGGYYLIKVVAGLEEAISEQVLLGGIGSQTNPYRVSMVSDVLAILDGDASADDYYQQVQDVLMTLTEPIEINNDRKIVFNGQYDGNDKAISFTGNGGLFHEISETGVVKNLIIDSTTTLSAAEDNLYPIGAVADTNNGLIENVDARASLTNARYQGELVAFTGTVDVTDQTSGAGGLVGVNGLTGTISNVSIGGAGAVKAGRGVGGVSAYNYGLIEQAYVTATLPAGNQANSGKSSNTYSFGGGITGYNFGTITQSVVSGRVFAQSAYSTSGDGNEGKNVGFGGIAGYNEGVISESSFARSLSAKEFIDKSMAEALGDSANNLGVASVHGDLYVGGIAGINAGEITNNYVGGAIIGGRDFVGGVTGLTLTGGTITNTYVFAEVAIKDDGGVKLTAADTKTTLTKYDIAPSGFDANTVFFRDLVNSSSSNAWASGDSDLPMLPEFNATDLAKVGNKFAASGVLLWQQGSVTGVNIVLDSVVLPFGATENLEYSITPTNAPDAFTTWTSSDEAIVEISGDGVITGVGAGSATVTVTTRDGGYTDTIEVTVENYIQITSVIVTADSITLPEVNNADVRDEIEIGSIIELSVEILPTDADYQGYTISTSNSRAEAVGNIITFVYGNTGPGSVSVKIDFEDASMETLEFRFTTVEGAGEEVPITSADVTTDVLTLPEANNDLVRDLVSVGTVATFSVDILPLNASNQNYTITTSNSRAEVLDNVVTFVYGNTGPGSVSVLVTFEDSAIGELEYRFTTFEIIDISSVVVTTDVLTLPEANNADVRDAVDIGTVVTFSVEILPADATNQNYTITTSNSRAEADGNVVTFVYGNTGPGSVSVYVTFEDPAIGELNYRFTTVAVD